MAGYELVFEGYEFARDDEGGETGTKTFVARGGAERDLPAMGTEFGEVEGTYGGSAPSGSCKLRKISCRVIGDDTKTYSCEYSTPDNSTSGVNHLRAPTDEVKSMRASAESFQIMGDEDSNQVKWADGEKVKGFSTAAIGIICLHYTVEENYDEFNDAFMACSVSKLNTVLSSNGHWLYEGFDIQQMKDEDNEDVFRTTRSYKYRSQEWNMFYRNDENGTGWEALAVADRPFDTSTSFPDSGPFS